MRLGALEIVLILVVVLILFGGNKLAGVGKALGQSIRDFKKKRYFSHRPSLFFVIGFVIHHFRRHIVEGKTQKSPDL